MFPRFNNPNTISASVMMSLPYEAINDSETMALQSSICSLQNQLSEITERLTMGGVHNAEREYLKTARSRVSADFDVAVFQRDKLIADNTSKARTRSFGAQVGFFAYRNQEQPATEEPRVESRQNERRFRTSSALSEEGMGSLEYQELRRTLSELTERLAKLESNFPTVEGQTNLPVTPAEHRELHLAVLAIIERLTKLESVVWIPPADGAATPSA